MNRRLSGLQSAKSVLSFLIFRSRFQLWLESSTGLKTGSSESKFFLFGYWSCDKKQAFSYIFVALPQSSASVTGFDTSQYCGLHFRTDKQKVRIRSKFDWCCLKLKMFIGSCARYQWLKLSKLKTPNSCKGWNFLGIYYLLLSFETTLPGIIRLPPLNTLCDWINL